MLDFFFNNSTYKKVSGVNVVNNLRYKNSITPFFSKIYPRHFYGKSRTNFPFCILNFKILFFFINSFSFNNSCTS